MALNYGHTRAPRDRGKQGDTDFLAMERFEGETAVQRSTTEAWLILSARGCGATGTR